MKKIICTALCASMLSMSGLTAGAQTKFTDVTGHWAASYIEEMTDMNFISGYGDGTFKPENDVSHLETLLLFARAMGSNSEAMSKVLEYAVEEYGEVVDKYELGFGKNEICFMLYRGAITVDELDEYIGAEVRNVPMKRHEAAVVITKAMNGEKEAKAELIFDLTYDDAKDIPAKTSRYVYYVTQKGIMNGITEQLFSPNGNVKRCQIAVMLSRAVEKMGVSFYEETIQEIDTDNNLIITNDGEFDYSEDTVIRIEGKKAKVSDLPEEVSAIFTVVGDELVCVDALASIPDEIVNGVFYEHFRANDRLNLKIRRSGSQKYEYFECIQGVKITRNGESSDIIHFKKGDYITLSLSNGKVTEIAAEQQTSYVQDAIISDIAIEDDLIVKIEHSDEKYNGMTLNIASDVSVSKNGASADLSKIYRGDTVTLTLEYGQVTRIVAHSTKKTVEGSIRSFTISANPSMVVSINGNEKEYDIPTSVKIKVNGEDASIYDFRLGDTVKITIESQAITSISTTSVQSGTNSITAGTVTAVNASYGFIKVDYEEAGVAKQETIMCKGSKLTVIDAAGKTGSLSSIKVGDVVTVRGTMDNGAFVASVILIESK